MHLPNWAQDTSSDDIGWTCHECGEECYLGTDYEVDRELGSITCEECTQKENEA